MSLASNVLDAFTRVGTEFKTVYGRIGTLANLTTTAKGSLVDAINEVKATPSGAVIDDVTPSATKVYSSSKTENAISAAVNALAAGAPGLLDTLDELASALGDDPNFAATMTTALGNRVRVDAAQAFDATQKAQARSNIGAGTSDLVIGTTAGTAKAGNYAPAIADISGTTAIARSILAAADAAAVRTLIGAGTSSLVIGTTSGTAKDGAWREADATTGAKGLVQLAGYFGGTATSPTVRDATTALKGAVMLATSAITATGTDATMAVTPAGLKSITDLLATKTDMGSPTTDFVTAFTAALV